MEPLRFYFEKYGFDPGRIAEIANGEKYLALVLDNGRIGVCAWLGSRNEPGMKRINVPDLNLADHRVVLNAYYNALLNYENEYYDEKDIFDQIDFSKYQNIVMIGYFDSLYRKFRDKGLLAKIFDMDKTDPVLNRLSEEIESVRNADAVILSATSIQNNTFMEITASVSQESDVFLLGPSSLLDSEMLNYNGMKYIFGALFEKNDLELLELVRNGAGTKNFLHRMQKVYIKK